MAWTAPRTWVTAEIVTASIMNTHVRDNLLQTGPAKATTTSGLIVSNGANILAERIPDGDVETGSVNTASTSYVYLAPSPQVANATTGTKAIVLWSAGISNSTAGAISYASFDITGATTASSGDSLSVAFESSAASDFATIGNAMLHTGLTAGSNTFTMQHRVTAGTGTYINRRLMVIPL